MPGHRPPAFVSPLRNSERKRTLSHPPLLHAWRLTVIATSRAGYYEELETVRGGTARTRPAEEVIPDEQERLAAARAHAVTHRAELSERILGQLGDFRRRRSMP